MRALPNRAHNGLNIRDGKGWLPREEREVAR